MLLGDLTEIEQVYLETNIFGWYDDIMIKFNNYTEMENYK